MINFTYQVPTRFVFGRGAEDQVLRLQGQEKQFEILLNAIVEAETSAQRERDALNARQTSDRERYAAQQAKIQVYTQQLAETRQTLAQLEGKEILAAIEGAKDLEAELMEQVKAMHDDHEHHHHHEEDEDEHEHCCHHHHEEDEDEHEHHHEHDENCTCGCHDHDHHHHHHADEIFTSWGFETPATYTTAEVEGFLKELDNEEKYGIVLRAKGMIPAADGTWIYFDYVPEESNVRAGKPDVTGKICVIGSKLKEAELENLFRK